MPLGLKRYLWILFVIMLLAMLTVWSSIPNSCGGKQSSAQPTSQSATIPETTAVTPICSKDDLRKWYNVWLMTFRPDVRILILVLVMGCIGGTLFGMMAFCHHWAVSDFNPQWNLWYWFRPPLGSGVALLVYLATNGGFLTTGAQATSTGLYGTAALAALCGMFSEQASKKLAEVFLTLFRTEDDVNRKNQENPQGK
jgi:hypothetical protein